MAKIEIESAFVEAWTKTEDQHPAWGMKTAEPHSRKNDAGKYETVARTYRTVKVSRSSGIDLTRFRKGDRVAIWGKEITETREYETDGEKRTAHDVVVWADRIDFAAPKSAAAPDLTVPTASTPLESTPPATAWADSLAEEMPF